jgi:hypothetical protein
MQGMMQTVQQRGPQSWQQMIKAVFDANPGIRPDVAAKAVSLMMPMMTLQSRQEWLMAHNQFLENQLRSRENIAGMQAQNRLDIAQLRADTTMSVADKKAALSAFLQQNKFSFQDAERIANEQFKTSEREAKQEHQTSEREGKEAAAGERQDKAIGARQAEGAASRESREKIAAGAQETRREEGAAGRESRERIAAGAQAGATARETSREAAAATRQERAGEIRSQQSNQKYLQDWTKLEATLQEKSKESQARIDAMRQRGQDTDARRLAEQRSREEQRERDRVAAAQRADARNQALKDREEFRSAEARARQAISVAARKENREARPELNALSKMTEMYSAVESFSKTAQMNGEKLIELAAKKDITGVPVIERWINMARTGVGDPGVTDFLAQLRIYKTEVARITQNPRLVGVLTDSSRRELDDILPQGANLQQIQHFVALANADAARRRQGIIDEIHDIRDRMSGQRNIGEPAEGTIATKPGSPPMVYRNHQWINQMDSLGP